MRKHIYNVAWKILANNYTLKKVNIILLIICSTILRNLLYFAMYYFLKSGSDIIDFVLSVIITVFLSIYSSFIDEILTKYQKYLIPVTKRIARIFIFRRFRLRKFKNLLIISIIAIICLCFFDVNSTWLIVSIIHFLICCFIIDKIEDWNNSTSYLGSLRTWFNIKLSKATIEQYDAFKLKKEAYYLDKTELIEPYVKNHITNETILEAMEEDEDEKVRNDERVKKMYGIKNIKMNVNKFNTNDYP